MSKLTFEELLKLKEANRGQVIIREGGYRARVHVFLGECGIAAGARQILQTLMEEINRTRVQDLVITTSGCGGSCSREPMMEVEIQGESPVRYGNLDPAKVREIFSAHLLGGKVVEKYTLTEETPAKA